MRRVLFGCCAAALASAAQGSNWVEYRQTGAIRVFYDADSIVDKAGYRYAWLKVIDPTEAPQTLLSYNRFNCRERTGALVALQVLDGGKASELFKFDEKDDLVPPDSVAELTWKAVCKGGQRIAG